MNWAYPYITLAPSRILFVRLIQVDFFFFFFFSLFHTTVETLLWALSYVCNLDICSAGMDPAVVKTPSR